MPTPENKKRAPKGGIAFTEPFTIVFFEQNCLVRLLTSGYCPIAPSRSSDDNQWPPLTGCDLKFQLQRRDRHGITPCSVYKAVFMICMQRYLLRGLMYANFQNCQQGCTWIRQNTSTCHSRPCSCRIVRNVSCQSKPISQWDKFLKI